MSDILIGATNNPQARAQAGKNIALLEKIHSITIVLALQLKNALYSKEDNLKQAYQDRWLNIPENIRIHIKNNVNIFKNNLLFLFF